ncbi:MAG: peptidoglycan DD-metalloendopeptidase family protein [Alphaproteobacteria bacterium]|nr:peptidoglycan DD-metalloendopeptidase family protein [Alphaproteobacteria bacterium]
MPWWLVSGVALGGGFRFPASDADHHHFYPTAYVDHGGVDWACGGIRYSGHGGSDFGVGGFDGMYAGREVVAAAMGTVLYTNDGEFDECTTGDCSGGGGFGNYVWLQHPDGNQTIYGHLRQWTVAVSPGDTVACGQFLGEVGSSGYSTGPHLHFEVRDGGGNKLDPFHGDCGSASSLWVDQGVYDGLPAPVCEDVPACAPIATLTCGDVVDSANDADGATSEHGFYGCAEWAYSGPEVVYQVISSRDETVSVTLTGLSADLDLYALADTACDGTGCVAGSDEGDASDEALSYTATAGQPTVLVVDGYEGAVSAFRLTVSCEGVWEEEGPGESGAPGDTGEDGASDGTTDGTPGEEDPAEGGPRPGKKGFRLGEEVAGCGCQAGAGLTGGWWVVLLVWGRRRRA